MPQAIVLVALLLLTPFAGAQEIPRPEELQAADARAEPLRIDSPKDGEQVKTPFTVTGLAPPGARLELWVGDALDRVFMADANGRFTSAVSKTAPGKIWVHQVNAAGQRVQSVGVAVVWAGQAGPVAAQPVREGGADVPTTPDEIAPLADNSEQPPQPEALPTVDELGTVDSLSDAPPPPSEDAFAPAPPPASDPSERRTLRDSAEADAQAPLPMKNTPPRGLRVLAEAGGGLAGAMAFGLGGALVGGLIGAGTDPGGWGILIGGVFGGVAGWAVGIPVGVVLTGNVMDGNGSILATIGGEAVGILAAAGITAAFPDGGPGLVAFIVLPIAGAVAGYELSSDASASQAEAQKRGLRSLRPVVAPSADGPMTFGFGLRF